MSKFFRTTLLVLHRYENLSLLFQKPIFLWIFRPILSTNFIGLSHIFNSNLILDHLTIFYLSQHHQCFKQRQMLHTSISPAIAYLPKNLLLHLILHQHGRDQIILIKVLCYLWKVSLTNITAWEMRARQRVWSECWIPQDHKHKVSTALENFSQRYIETLLIQQLM